MAVEILMSKFGLSVEEGLIGSWLKKEGDSVKKGDLLEEIETDKITNSVECPEEGVLLSIKYESGETVKCGEILCVVGEASESLGEVEITPRAKKIAEQQGI